jgi:hypothetical protein
VIYIAGNFKFNERRKIMRLSDKLTSISRNDMVAELGEMLNHARVSISWYGQRVVSVDGYEGSVEVNELALKYLKANAFQRDGDPSIKERLDCYALWGRVQKLYIDSNDELNKTWVFKYLTPMKEFRPYCRACAGDPMAIIGEWEFGAKKDSLLEFTPEEFKKMWPEVEPQGQSWIMGGGERSEKWTATKEMVESVFAQKIQ